MNDTIGTVTATDTGEYVIMTDKGLMPMTMPVTATTLSSDAWNGNITAATIVGSNGTSSPIINGGIGAIGNTLRLKSTVEEVMDEHSLNRIAIDHKVTAQELLKLQEVAPDYASEFKENIVKNLARIGRAHV